MKRKYRLYSLVILSLILFVSCKNESSKAINIFKDINSIEFESEIQTSTISDIDFRKIIIPNFRKEQDVKLSTWFDSISFVKLSNEPEAIVGVIDKIVISDTCFYILDRYKTKSLKKFAPDGSYLSTIGKHGGGPDEYIEPTDFIISDNTIILYDQFKSDLKYYDLDGNLKYTKRLPWLCLKFFCFSPNHYIFHTIDADNGHLSTIVNYSVFDSDSSFVLKNRAFYRPQNKYISYIGENNFSANKNKTFYHPPFNDTIYSINSDFHIKVEYVLDFQNKKIPDYLLFQANKKKLENSMDQDDYAFFQGNYVITNNYLYFEYSIKHLIYRGVYSRETNQVHIGNRFLNDINAIFPLDNIISSKDNNILVGYMQSYLIGDNFNKYSRNEWVEHIGEENTRIAESITSEDNPILLFFKIKDF